MCVRGGGGGGGVITRSLDGVPFLSGAGGHLSIPSKEARRGGRGVIKRSRDGGAERPLDTGLSLTKSSREGFVGEEAFSFCLDFNVAGTF